VSKLPLPDLGAYLREQREHAQLSLRQLADLAGISNPYLSQIERGLKRPSAEILQQIAKGLQVSAESLYVRAGILDERVTHDDEAAASGVLEAIAADPALTDRQRGVLVEIYLSFVGEIVPAGARSSAALAESVGTRPQGAAPRRRRLAQGTKAGPTPDQNPDHNPDLNPDLNPDVTTNQTTDVHQKEN
jgi:transcriptional regulator with XRE-family HTH domain